MNIFADDFVIKKTILACHVRAGTGRNEIKDRSSHGVALFLGNHCTVLFADKTRLQLNGPSAVYFPKGCSYTINEQTSADWYAINFQLLGGDFAPFAMGVELARYEKLFQAAVGAWNSRKEGYEWQIRGILYEILYRLRRQSVHADTDDRIAPALRFIHENYLTETISVAYLAELCGVSQVYLRRQFSARLGQSPNRYITALKLEKAAQLLQSGMYTAAEVCYLSGFRDESYFNRSFKKHYGITPGKYGM